MYFVYFLQSINNPKKTYIGYTCNIEERLIKHNQGGSIHTSKHKPWKLIGYIAFESDKKAMAFETYSKYGSGNAFVKKHLW